MGLRKKLIVMVAGAMAATSIAAVANADTLSYNTALANGVYFGTGNPNAGYTTNTRSSDGLELGLGVSLRSSGAIVPSPTNSSIYYVPTGYDHVQPNTNRAAWNFNFSVDTPSGFALGADHWDITILNVGNSQTFSYDPTFALNDNATRANALVTDLRDFQNSENLVFYPTLLFDMNANDQYFITLSLLDANNASVFGVSETINATPLPSTWLMLLSGFVGLGFFAYRGTKKRTVLAAA